MSWNYSVILGNLGNTRDRFCGGYKDNPTSIEMLKRAAAIPHVKGIELVGTWDVTPTNARQMGKALKDLGMACVCIIPDLFADADYGKGSYCSTQKKIRQKAVDYTLVMCDVARALSCDLLDLWPGQDGYDYLLTCDYDAYRSHFRDCVASIAQKNPDIRLALEYKPKEPRCFSLVSRMADTLLMCQEIDEKNVGVCIDTGHSFVAGETTGEAIVLAKRCGDRLFHMHFNDNHGAWDDDMIVGATHHTTYIEILYWLKRTGYKGWLSMDQYPYREDAAGAIGESILWLKGFAKIVSRHGKTIDKLISEGDAVATSRFVRSMLVG